jgi:hypothetical protein
LNLLLLGEYPRGQDGNGDIDSGPVVFGVGAAATIVAQRTMAVNQDDDKYECLRNTIETFGYAHTNNKHKNYICGEMPIADAFIAWSNSVEQNEGQIKSKTNWRLEFQIYSLAVLFLNIILVWRLLIARKK